MPVFVMLGSPSSITHCFKAGNLTRSTTIPSLAKETQVLINESWVEITRSFANWRAIVLQSSIALDPKGTVNPMVPLNDVLRAPLNVNSSKLSVFTFPVLPSMYSEGVLHMIPGPYPKSLLKAVLVW